ncbi:heme biosynthesis HemY N-terminal domain-containing protein [Thiomicrorhabdus sediminis]|uniref:Heme biosynthesis protein HemY n=1 Tax=Thiomicrorhabdus sediminis TaxID=2580412 RepID=A0A4P9K316_9GAMM|nr:heme biosynthesis HemY N-terminal domain-containing protein [Thiomicrorhabdus sediminis]QCU89218.1 heme biosynthesis protein HemY [Thiomicrorhabdus sediminis]
MRTLISFAVALLIATAIATLLLYDNGRMSLEWGDWILEASASFMLAVILVVFIVGYMAIRFAVIIWHIPHYWRRRKRLKQYSRAENAMAKGMIALEYGDWHKAEKELVKSAKNSEAGLVHYLSAAKMAHNQQAHQRRNQYLAQARELYPAEYVTIGLVEARLLKEDELEAAVAILQELHQQQPKNATILAELAFALRDLGYWQSLAELMPKVKRSAGFSVAEYSLLEQQLWAGQLAAATDFDALQTIWQGLNRKQKLIAEIVAEYVEQCLGWGQEADLKNLLERAIKKQWNDRLVYQYGRLTLGPAFDRLKVAESWLQADQENNPVLLLTLGRLACRSQLWGMGQGYLKRSLKIRPEIETFHALAQCYEAEGQENQAALTYKEAILQLEKK